MFVIWTEKSSEIYRIIVIDILNTWKTHKIHLEYTQTSHRIHMEHTERNS